MTWATASQNPGSRSWSCIASPATIPRVSGMVALKPAGEPNPRRIAQFTRASHMRGATTIATAFLTFCISSLVRDVSVGSIFGAMDEDARPTHFLNAPRVCPLYALRDGFCRNRFVARRGARSGHPSGVC